MIKNKISNVISRFRKKEAKLITIPHNHLPELLFGQQHIRTQDYFIRNLGSYHSVNLRHFPHYQFLESWLDDPFNPANPYIDYLACSWDYYFGEKGNTETLRRQKVESFIEYYRTIETQKNQGNTLIDKPLQICYRPDGKMVVIDGNHRAAIAYKLGLDAQAEVILLPSHLANIVAVPDEFFGTKRLNKPYQSVFYKGCELVEGRRRDVLSRMKFIRPDDLKGKSVLDLGCNLGMSSYIAAEMGATKVLGVEASSNIASAAVRLNSIFASPCVFLQHDLNLPIPDVEKFDTVFCFSVLSHIKSHDGIIQTLKNSVTKVLYLEGHANTTNSDYLAIFNALNFSKTELIGYMSDGTHSEKNSRPLWRCEI